MVLDGIYGQSFLSWSNVNFASDSDPPLDHRRILALRAFAFQAFSIGNVCFHLLLYISFIFALKGWRNFNCSLSSSASLHKTIMFLISAVTQELIEWVRAQQWLWTSFLTGLRPRTENKCFCLLFLWSWLHIHQNIINLIEEQAGMSWYHPGWGS